MSYAGYIKLLRKIKNWEWYTDANTFRLFIHLLLSAAHKQTKWRGIILLPGQLITGRVALSKDLNLSEREIRTSLKKLKSTNDIAIKSTNKFSLITICKWNAYQNDGSYERPAVRPVKSPTSDQQKTTNKNIKEENIYIRNEEDKNIDLLNSVVNKNQIILPEGFRELILTWQKYKSEKNQDYKDSGLYSFISVLLKDSGADFIIAKEMVDYSMSRNYSGLFKPSLCRKTSQSVPKKPTSVKVYY